MMRRKKGLRIASGAHLKTAVRFYLTDSYPELRYRLIIRVFRPPPRILARKIYFCSNLKNSSL